MCFGLQRQEVEKVPFQNYVPTSWVSHVDGVVAWKVNFFKDDINNDKDFTVFWTFVKKEKEKRLKRLSLVNIVLFAYLLISSYDRYQSEGLS